MTNYKKMTSKEFNNIIKDMGISYEMMLRAYALKEYQYYKEAENAGYTSQAVYHKYNWNIINDELEMRGYDDYIMNNIVRAIEE